MMNKLDKIFLSSKKISINKHSKIVIMSDCHRGNGNINDNFAPNQHIFKEALKKYYNKKFTYIELGDGDELWELDDYKTIYRKYTDIFGLLSKFHKKRRLIMIYGNHDLCKKSKDFIDQNFKELNIKNPFTNLFFRESIILNFDENDIFLLHGHQVDFLNSTLWRLSKFLVKYVWKTLESLGMKAPKSNSKNHPVTSRIEKKLEKWSIRNNKILISGHTHKAIFPLLNSLYFNDGSCINASGITALEIENGNISLVNWNYMIRRKKIKIERKIIEGPKNIKSFIKSN